MPYVNIPILNPIHLTEINTQSSKYVTIYHDVTQTNCYVQPVKLIDGLFFELITDFAGITIQSFLCEDDTIIHVDFVTIPVSVINGSLVYRIHITDEYFNYAENKIYLKITLGSGNDPNRIELESNILQGVQTNTDYLEFEYTGGKDNTKGVVFYPPEFELSNPKRNPYTFKMLVEGGVYAHNTKLNSKNFIDQRQNYSKLSSFPYNTYKLNVGGTFRVPEWLAEKINYIFTLSYMTIDGKRFIVEEGNSLTTKAQNYQSRMYFYEVDIIEAASRSVQKITKGASLSTTTIMDIDTQVFGSISYNNNSITVLQID